MADAIMASVKSQLDEYTEHKKERGRGGWAMKN